MISLLKWCSEIFWFEKIWLGSEYKWKDVTNGSKNILYPDVKDFRYAIFFAVMLLVLRRLLDRYFSVPLGKSLGIKIKKLNKPQDIPLLESAYRKSPDLKDVTGLAKQLDMKERQVERWWRLRRKLDSVPEMTKFCENVWGAYFFGLNALTGFYILWDKDYFWDIYKCFIGYPHQGLTNDVWWYYMINSGYAWSAIIVVCSDMKRKDFMTNLVHHILNALLLSISWMSSFYRIGAVLIPFTDISGALLEVLKIMVRVNLNRMAVITYVIFIVSWFYTRMYVLPVHIFYKSVRASSIEKSTFMSIFLLVQLFLLILLQVFWSKLIIEMGYNFFKKGVVKDVRSSNSEDSDEIIDEKNNYKIYNGDNNIMDEVKVRNGCEKTALCQ